MTFLITFYTHFDANVFMRKAKTLGTAKLKPVPRVLSSSCGTCVDFKTDEDFDPSTLQNMEFEDFYQVLEEGYKLLYHKEQNT